MPSECFSIADLFLISYQIKFDSDDSSAIDHSSNKNTVFISSGQDGLAGYQLILVAKALTTKIKTVSSVERVRLVFPLYIYNEDSAPSLNLNREIIKNIAGNLNLTFVPEKEVEGNVCFMNSEYLRSEFRVTFSAIDLPDYVYAALQNEASYEETEKHFGIVIPKIPYLIYPNTFWDLVSLGSRLRKQHLIKFR